MRSFEFVVQFQIDIIEIDILMLKSLNLHKNDCLFN